MKASIDKNGNVWLRPENETEIYALKKWDQENKVKLESFGKLVVKQVLE